MPYKDPARRAAYYATWRAANRERLAAYRAAYHAANQARHAANQVAWRAANPELVRALRATERARKAGAVGTRTAGQVAARWAMWGGLCWMCGAPATSTDHVKPLAEGGSNWSANLRPACGPCNSRKGDRWPFDTSTRSTVAA
jgi:5-methylcytosine-specific restriction endonuclease McrA